MSLSPDHSSGSSRRNFMKECGMAIVAGSLGGYLSDSVEGATRPAQPLILGAANHRYEWVRGWGKLPAGMNFGSTHGAVQLDSQGRVYFNTDTENAIIVFDADGNFVKAMGKEWKGGTHGMIIRREGKQEFIYLTNLARSEFAKLTLDGEVVWVKGYPDKSGVYTKKEEFKPTGISFAPNGSFYVTDGYGKQHVHQYDAKGEYVRSWGGKGTENGKFNTPHAILVDTRGKTPLVLVTDRANHRLQWFSLDGQHVKTLDGVAGDLLRLPATLSQRGTDLVIGDLAGRLTILDKNDRLVTHLGDNVDPKKRATNKLPSTDWLDGQFIAPHGVSWDRQGNLYVEEWMAIGRIVKLKRVK
ncbi:MAG: twin-arginine translocation signal domain-containing protein [Acidobacteriota bacterium]